MQKILVVSDTHGHDNNFYDVLDIEEPVDGIIHCGDFEGSEGKFALAANCPVYFVAGNNDFFASLSREIAELVSKYKTKQGINNALVKRYGADRAYELYKKVKPLLSDKKGN